MSGGIRGLFFWYWGLRLYGFHMMSKFFGVAFGAFGVIFRVSIWGIRLCEVCGYGFEGVGHGFIVRGGVFFYSSGYSGMVCSGLCSWGASTEYIL